MILAFIVVYFVYIVKNIVDTALEFAELMDSQPIHVNGSAVVNGQDLPLYMHLVP